MPNRSTEMMGEAALAPMQVAPAVVSPELTPPPEVSARASAERDRSPDPDQASDQDEDAIQPKVEQFGSGSGGYRRQRTEALDPEAITALFPQNLPVDDPEINNATTKQALTSRRDSAAGIDPDIANALQDPSRHSQVVERSRVDSDSEQVQHTTDHLRPDQSNAKTDASALQRNDGRHDSDHYAPSAISAERRPTSEVDRPHNDAAFGERAIETDRPVDRAATTAPAWRQRLVRLVLVTGFRLLAGVLDGLQILILMVLISVPLISAGYVVALLTAHVGLDDSGLPHRYSIEPAAGIFDILISLCGVDGWVRLTEMVEILRDRSQQAFLYFFLGTVAAVLANMFVLLVGLIAPTTYKGAPFWHRRLGLVIVERGNGYYPTPIRACLRWLLLVLLLPVVPLFALVGLRGPHDLLTNCAVRHQRLSLPLRE